jgi:hypothetical protein
MNKKSVNDNLDLLVSKSDLLMTQSPFNAEQLTQFYSKTPADKVKSRRAKGGGTWQYVETSYVIDTLNRLFGYMWSFEVLTGLEEAAKISASGTCVVKGRLTVYVNGMAIVKEQFGRCECKHMKDSDKFLDFGNDMKGASSDALKKCASELGLFRDIYSKDDVVAMNIVEDDEKQSIIDTAIAEALEKLKSSKNLRELKVNFCSLNVKIRTDDSIIALKDEMKLRLEKKEENESIKDSAE